MSINLSQAKRAIIYCRVSGKMQEENYSLGAQESDARSYCAQHGYIVIDVVREVHTGAELDERPEITAIRRRFRIHDFDVLVVWKFDRLSREQTHQAVVIYEASKHSIRIESVHEKFDDTPLGRFMRSIIGFVAEIEREDIKLRMRTGRERRIASGKNWGNGNAAYGYRFNETHDAYEINPETAPVVQRIFRDVANGESQRTLIETLHNEGIKSPWGSEWWSWSTMRIVLHNPVYWGMQQVYRYRNTKVTRFDDEGNPRIRRVREPGQRLPAINPAPALVSEDLAMEAIAQIDSRQGRPPGPQPKNPHNFLLFQRIFCGHCERMMRSKMYTPQKYKARRMYLCGNERYQKRACHIGMSAPILEQFVWEEVFAVMQTPGLLYQRLTGLSKDEPVEDIPTLQEQLTQIQGDQKRLTKVLARIDDDDESTLAPLLAELQSLGKLKDGVQKRLNDIVEGQARREREQIIIRRLTVWAAQMTKREFTIDEKRVIIEALGVTVKLYSKNHNPRYEVVFPDGISCW